MRFYRTITFVSGLKKAAANTDKFCRFICRHDIHIACHYICDGQVNCPFGEDEKDCPGKSLDR